MNIDELRKFCLAMPAATEDIKWGNDLVFSVAGKMFCVCCVDPPNSISFKVQDEEFEELCENEGVIPAPYVARYKWIQLANLNVFGKKELRNYVLQSYNLVKAKLPKKVLADLRFNS